jgi:hypothetical protein
VFPAEYHDRIAGRAAVGTCTQPPPHAERINDRHPRADIEQSFYKTLGRIGLPRAGRADDRDSVIKHLGGKSGRRKMTAGFGGGGLHPTFADSGHRVRGFRSHGDPCRPTHIRVFVHDSFGIL